MKVLIDIDDNTYFMFRSLYKELNNRAINCIVEGNPDFISSVVKSIKDETVGYPPSSGEYKMAYKIIDIISKEANNDDKKDLSTLKAFIDANELISRITEKSKLPSLSADTINGLCGAISIIYDMLNESGEESDNNG